MSKNDTTGYFEVGFGKPPRERVFPRTTSANPKGRLKKEEKASSFARMFDECMSGGIEIPIKGKSKKVRRKKAFLMKVFRNAINGDPRAARQLMDLFKLAGLLDPNPQTEPSAFLVLREPIRDEGQRAFLAARQKPFRDGANPPARDEILARSGLKKPDRK